jgi:hypothetical protein
MWQLQAAQAGASVLGNLALGILGRGQAKRIGTIEQQFYEQEERRARERSGEINPAIAQGYHRAGQWIEDTAFPEASRLQAAGEAGARDIMGATREGLGYLSPYAEAGGRAITGLEELAGAKAPGAADLEFDPGYQFRLSEGERALQRSAAARGGLQGGGTLRALTRYSQGEASQEYAAAFDRFMRGQTARRETLGTLAGYGARAGEAMATNVQRGAGAAAEFGYQGLLNAANIRNRAAETIGGYGIDSALKQAGYTAEDIAYARAAREGAMKARTGSMAAASNAFTQGLAGAFGGAQQGLSLLDLSKRKTGAGSYPDEI